MSDDGHLPPRRGAEGEAMTKREEARAAVAYHSHPANKKDWDARLAALERAVRDEEAEAIMDIGTRISHDVGSRSIIMRQHFNEEVRARISERNKEKE